MNDSGNNTIPDYGIEFDDQPVVEIGEVKSNNILDVCKLYFFRWLLIVGQK
jgi:hypothetical protein